MELKSLADFLKKFELLVPPHKVVKENLTKAILEVTGITVEDGNIAIQGSVAFLKLSPIKKTEILLKGKAILLELERRGTTRITVIR